MKRTAMLATVMLMMAACDEKPTEPCPPGYLLGPLQNCYVNQDAPPCECFEESPYCCGARACKRLDACTDDVWACEEGQQLIGHCDLPDLAANQEE